MYSHVTKTGESNGVIARKVNGTVIDFGGREGSEGRVGEKGLPSFLID